MAPFIPHGLINPELTLFFAWVLGLAFGYILEQAGFSSSRKLAGLFYGYDFVVLKVFFTAGITAMTGLIFLEYLGFIDMNLVYINPTYLWSGIVGGLIMGAGFIMGGFCPGTSLVGAVIGKIDAMVFIGGMFIGIFFFGHFYDVFEPLYTGSFLGNIQIFDMLGISKAWFALLLGLMALMAFAITQLIEDKVNKVDPSRISSRPSFMQAALLLVLLLLVYLALPEKTPSRPGEISEQRLLAEWQQGTHRVSAERVASFLMRGQPEMVLIDLRDADSFRHFHLPGSMHLDPVQMNSRQWRRFFRQDKRDKVFISDGGTLAMQAWMNARRAGYERLFVLEDGLNGLFSYVFVDQPDDGSTRIDEQFFYGFEERFARQARQFFLEGGAARVEKERQVPVETIIEVVLVPGGGC